MKKILIRAAAIITLLLLFLYAFLEFRQFRSYNIPVHANAGMIIKLNADAFIRTMIWDNGFNFTSRINRTGKKEKGKPIKTGLQIPANIFLHSVSSKNAGTFFCTLKIKNADAFKYYLETNYQIQLKQTESYFSGKKDNITILFNKNYAAIAYSKINENVNDVLEDLLSGNNLLPINDLLIKKLKKKRNHITFVTKDALATFDFEGRKLFLNAVIRNSTELLVPETRKKRVFSSDACGSFYFNAKPSSSLFKPSYHFRKFSFESDSILKYWNGYADMELLGSVTQQDTITTYDYDDNFEKKEKQTITEVKTPLLFLQLSTRTSGLAGYLKKQGIITTDNKINKEVFPLYNVSTTETKSALLFSTAENTLTTKQSISAAPFFELLVNFNQLRKHHDFPLLNKYTSHMNDLSFTGIFTGAKTISLKGNVDFDQSALKTITEILGL